MIRILAGEGSAVTALLETAALNAKYVRVPLISNIPNLLESIGNRAVHSANSDALQLQNRQRTQNSDEHRV